jgi:hypothetical protein
MENFSTLAEMSLVSRRYMKVLCDNCCLLYDGYVRLLPDACMEDYSTLAEKSLVSGHYVIVCYVTTAACYMTVMCVVSCLRCCQMLAWRTSPLWLRCHW